MDQAEQTAAEITTETTTNGDGPERSPAEHRHHTELFRYSRYLHVGPGAEECPEGEDGSCANPLHFHAWLRLPNQFQHSSIREKALAAKARRLRQLRDPESDVRAVLDSEVDEMRYSDDRELLLNELVNKDFLKVYGEALNEVAEEEEFEHIDEDRERFRALGEQSEEDRPAEEYAELEAHINAHTERVNAVYEERQKPLRDSLDERSTDELCDMVRDDRIQREGGQEYFRVYAMWEWYIGTMKPTASNEPAKLAAKPGLPSQRMFTDITQLQAAAPEVINALEQAFTELDAEASQSLKAS